MSGQGTGGTAGERQTYRIGTHSVTIKVDGTQLRIAGPALLSHFFCEQLSSLEKLYAIADTPAHQGTANRWDAKEDAELYRLIDEGMTDKQIIANYKSPCGHHRARQVIKLRINVLKLKRYDNGQGSTATELVRSTSSQDTDTPESHSRSCTTSPCSSSSTTPNASKRSKRGEESESGGVSERKSEMV